MEPTAPTKIPGTRPWADWRHLILILGAAIAFRYACHCLMLIPVLCNELRPAPSPPDLLLAHVPFVPWVARWNYVMWIACYLPPALYLLYRDRKLFVRFVILDGAISLIRGLCIPLTGLGPPRGPDLNGLHPFDLWQTWLSVVNPISAIAGDSAGVYLKKDMFFSGHIATTFMLYLFSRRLGGRAPLVYLGLQLFSLAVVLLSHLHYSIDIVGAYAIVFMVYTVGDAALQRRFPALRATETVRRE
jgi:hypothetical protein